MMQLIPVIDLKGGVVVRARRGERAKYAPLQSPLARSCRVADVAAGFLALAPFRTLYVADIDAITGAGDNAAAVAELRAAFPQLELWVDAGETTPAAVRARAAAGLGTSVIGTESLADLAMARAVLEVRPALLSLDHDASGPLGPLDLHQRPELWPTRVIVMTLGRVGSGSGPDLEALRRVAALRPGGSVIAAGGVRDEADLEALAGEGVAGALVASALHDGRLDAATARRWAAG